MFEYPWQVNGAVTRVIEAGGDGLPVVLLHGVGARADRWRSNVERFAEAGLHVYALDFPGHGFASKGDEFDDYSIDGYATFVARFLDSIEADRAVLIGTSLGGHVAARVTCRGPERVAALVMVGTLGVVPMGEEARAGLADSLADTTEQGIRAKLERVIYDSSSVTDDWVLAESRINSSPGAKASFEALGAYFRNRIDQDLVIDGLRRLAHPPDMLLIWGREDQIVPLVIGEQSRELLGERVALRTIASTGHAPYLEAPSQFNEIVMSFLQEASVFSK
ncbi:MAG: alpha/beta fold hydrolase [Rhodanobacteraceae bacterium]